MSKKSALSYFVTILLVWSLSALTVHGMENSSGTNPPTQPVKKPVNQAGRGRVHYPPSPPYSIEPAAKEAFVPKTSASSANSGVVPGVEIAQPLTSPLPNLKLRLKGTPEYMKTLKNPPSE